MNICKTIVAAGLFLLTAVPIQAQLLYSFESDLGTFIPQGGPDSDYINHFQSTTGATEGTMAMGIETGTTFGRDVEAEEIFGPVYDIFNAIAADAEAYTFDFDVTFTEAGWANVADVGTFFQINVFSNSDSGFRESFGVVNGSLGSASNFAASMPASQISLAVDSSFFQVGFGTNSNHTDGPGGEGVQYFIDNVRFELKPQFNEKPLFSWETPDDPGTTAVNEQLEGWEDGFSDQPFFHTRGITTEGATEGASAMSLVHPQSGFSWASQYQISADGFPENQPKIDELIGDFNSADRIAFDVTFADDQALNDPTFLSLFLNVSDQDGTFYQSPAKQAGNPVSDAGNTIAIEIPLSEMTAGGMNLADDGLNPGNYLRIALATNTNDIANFSIDNFRLLTEITDGLACDLDADGDCDVLDLDELYATSPTQAEITTWLADASDPTNPYKLASGGTIDDVYVLGDVDLDGNVDSADLGLLLNNFGSTSGLGWGAGNLNADANIDSADLGLLLNNFGHVSLAAAAVPEPNAVNISLLALLFAAICGRKRR